MGAADSRLDFAERERLRLAHSGSGLDGRLAQLPDGHPSSSGYADSSAPRNEVDYDGNEPDRIRPLTDAEYAGHRATVEAKLDEACRGGLETYIQHTIDQGHEVWSAKRELQHNAILDDLYCKAQTIPCEGRAIVTGGLAGAGKTTVLRDRAEVDLDQYLVINPDEIKQEMARRGMVPEVDGLSPMETVKLVHEESSHIAKRLAQRAVTDGRNIIWDITMSSEYSTQKRVDGLRAAGYGHVEGIFVDIPLDASIRRSDGRHREGHENYRLGVGLGGRFISADLIQSQADPEWGSRNRKSFEMLKSKLDAWSVYDNSVDGMPSRLVEAGLADWDEQREQLSE